MCGGRGRSKERTLQLIKLNKMKRTISGAGHYVYPVYPANFPEIWFGHDGEIWAKLHLPQEESGSPIRPFALLKLDGG